MSGSRSMFRRVMRIPSGLLALGYPVTAHRATATRNNIQFLIEQSAQHRVNWVAANQLLFTELASIGLDRFMVDNTSGSEELRRFWNAEFEHTWLRGDMPAGLDFEITGLTYGADSGYEINYKVVPASTPPNHPPTTAWIFGTGSESTADTTITLEGQATFESGQDQSGVFLVHSIAEPDGFFRAPQTAQMRIEVELVCPPGEKLWLTSVLVREFSWQ